MRRQTTTHRASDEEMRPNREEGKTKYDCSLLYNYLVPSSTPRTVRTYIAQIGG